MKPALRHNLLTSSRLAVLALTAFGSMPAIATDLPGTVDIIAGTTNGQVVWSLNIGNTAVYGPESYVYGGAVAAGSSEIKDIDSGDLDGDGWEDVITASYPLNDMVACFNTGADSTATTPFVCTRNATFFDTQGVALATISTSPYGWGNSTDATVADFNGDGRDDVTSGQWLCMSKSDRTFECEVLTRVGSSVGAVSEAGDLDDDGDVDLFVASGGESSWYLETCLNQGDTDGNEIPNFACTTFAQYNGNKLLRGTPWNVELGDYSGDGKLDAYVYTNKVPHTCIGEGNGSFLSTNCLRPDMQAANFIDWDGDGDMELLGGPYTGPRVSVWDRTNRTWSSASIPCAQVNAWTTPAVRDIDGDGHMEWTQGQHLYKATGYLNGAPQCTKMQHAVLGGSATPLFININEPLPGSIVDSDGDGVPDSEDACPTDPTGSVDTDLDGVCDGTDLCPDDNPNDGDGDGICESDDLCPTVFDPDPADQDDFDLDGIGDLCDSDWDCDGTNDGVDLCLGFPDAQDSDGDYVPDGPDAFGELCDICPDDFENDADGDGHCESVDNCDDLPNSDQLNTDSDGLGNACDDDDDNDGVVDTSDAFPLDSAEYIDSDGDGTGNNADTDDDNDTVLDGDDAFPYDSTESVDTDGDGIGDNGDACFGNNTYGDTDSDGVCDDLDFCPTDPADTDDDGDLVCDVDDLCVGDNSYGDTDGDQVCEDLDICTGNDAAGDTDIDGTCDDGDNCPIDVNVDQADADGDTIGDVCEADTDEDGVIDDYDNCDQSFNPDQADTDGDAGGDACDTDDDADGLADASDNCPLVANANQANFDGDGQGDACDGDDDADGVLDGADLCPQTAMGVTFDQSGCSGTQYVAYTVGSCSSYSNHGQYVRAVTHAANAAVRLGLLSANEKGVITRNAAKSCGQ